MTQIYATKIVLMIELSMWINIMLHFQKKIERGFLTLKTI